MNTITINPTKPYKPPGQIYTKFNIVTQTIPEHFIKYACFHLDIFNFMAYSLRKSIGFLTKSLATSIRAGISTS